QSRPSQIPDGVVRIRQRRNATFDRFEIEFWDFITGAGTSNAKQTATLQILHIVTAHAGIVPIGHKQRSVRRDTNVGRAKPIITCAVENIDRFSGVPRAVVLDGIGANNIRASVTMNNLIRSEEHTSELQSRENLVCRL